MVHQLVHQQSDKLLGKRASSILSPDLDTVSRQKVILVFPFLFLQREGDEDFLPDIGSFSSGCSHGLHKAGKDNATSTNRVVQVKFKRLKCNSRMVQMSDKGRDPEKKCRKIQILKGRRFIDCNGTEATNHKEISVDLTQARSDGQSTGYPRTSCSSVAESRKKSRSFSSLSDTSDDDDDSFLTSNTHMTSRKDSGVFSRLTDSDGDDLELSPEMPAKSHYARTLGRSSNLCEDRVVNHTPAKDDELKPKHKQCRQVRVGRKHKKKTHRPAANPEYSDSKLVQFTVNNHREILKYLQNHQLDLKPRPSVTSRFSPQHLKAVDPGLYKKAVIRSKVKVSLGCERLPTPLKKKKKKKKKKGGSGSLPAPRSGCATTITLFFCSFTHLTIPRSPPKFNQFFLVLLRTRP